ncbi:TonB-linked SusC/RagA family outer membrane protein [Mucilaginibacter sp. SG538B]|uniref:SusC/RagA family TonB-linked outer membrane protein n=1 Tax=Mucilaginibacter sp. SG538B TaxID=2587021 RepID=UPI00159E71EC|nr:SusC/RagA family TonB-linked outer membrane protein [Mucilaginibacter sp. SG538B]NVM66620.1 TonB-linked SusC/RagA family outer membrane protein [Mucilaginibacter sp. SG538B]
MTIRILQNIQADRNYPGHMGGFYKMVCLFFWGICLVLLPQTGFGQEGIIRGHVTTDAGLPLHGATVRVKGGDRSTLTDSAGNFSVSISGKVTLEITFVGYTPSEINVLSRTGTAVNIVLNAMAAELKEVVVSTGYQSIPAERATGSFVQVDNKLLNRRVSTGVLDRLEDVTPGLLFNKGKSANANPLSIRGQNTIYGNANPLIVIDNFPYDGNINNINPNDVESMTVLKDAAAASIWGSRAGNGVIVITTKKAAYKQPLRVSFNANTTVGEKPDAFYQPRMSTTDFIDMEKMLFAKGFYKNQENGYNHPALTPVVELLIAGRDGKISADDMNRQIDAFRAVDVRNQFDRYFYQKSISQQYALNLSGGSENQRFFIGGGYDHNRDNLTYNGFERYTLNASQTVSMLKRKLELTTAFYLTESNRQQGNAGTGLIGLKTGAGNTLYPYAQLADAAGNPLPIAHDHRQVFIHNAENAGLLDWSYRPLEELRSADNTLGVTDYRVNTTLSYKLTEALSASVLYQYGHTLTTGRNLQGESTYYARDLVNSYTQAGDDGSLTYGIPKGGILDMTHTEVSSQSFRGQLSFNKTWRDRHAFNAIAGYELRNLHTVSDNNRAYGYDDAHATVLPVNYITPVPQYAAPGNELPVPYDDSFSDLTDRNISYYANAAYTYGYKYTLSASARRDRSNLFGVNANRQGVPLYSAGLSWNVDREDFYKMAWLPYLKLRLTYGFNGNINKTLSAYTTAQYLDGNAINTIYAQVRNPPNPDLRWERVRVINAGVDFETAGNRISGTVEPYWKRGIDLIGDIAFAPSTGISTFRGNTANTSGKGIDLTINSRNLTGEFKWQTTLLFSHVTDEVTGYAFKQDAASTLSFGESQVYPMQGRPFYALYGYKWAGLDPQTGDPRGYLNGQVSKNYAQIINAATADSLQFIGPARPTTYGALRNTFAYRQFSLSANISYRFGYYFRQPGIAYNAILTGQGYYAGLYSQRWQHPGDELHTNVPSLPAGLNGSRDNFYNYSAALAEKGDNIRLQDISLSYTLSKAALKSLPIRQLSIYGYANNLGILWKATKTKFDPDYSSAAYPPVKTFALGLKADF